MSHKRIDLNLLTVLEVLMRERNVTRTAKRLGLSQPAVSSALGRLREALDDPLLVRTKGGMRPTPRAHQMISSISLALDSIQATLQPQSAFNPKTDKRSLTLMLTDLGEITYLPKLMARVRSEAPGVRLLVRPLARGALVDELGFGNVDLAVGHVEPCPAGLCKAELFLETFVCMVRPGHPRIGKRLTYQQFQSEWHLIVGQPISGQPDIFRSRAASIEQMLSGLEIERKVALSVPYFVSTPAIIANTDLVCTVPREFGQVYAAHGFVRLVPLPFGTPSFTVSQFWHQRFNNEPSNIFLRQHMRELFGQAKRSPSVGRLAAPE